MVIRLCHLADFGGGFFQLEDAQEGIFGGWGSYIANGFVNKLKRATNSSVIITTGNKMNQQRNEMYNGCIGQLERNESDVVLSAVEYPLDNPNIEQGTVLFETGLAFLQEYFFADFKAKDVQMLNTLGSLSKIAHLILSFLSASILFFLLAEKMIIRRSRGHQRQQLFTNVLLHCTRLGSICDNSSPGYRIMFASLSIFSLLVIQYFYSWINTDLVVVEDPELWFTYDDLIKDEVRPMTVREFNVHWYFKNAHPTSPERKLWDWAVAKFEEDALVLPAAPNTFRKFGNYMLYRRGVAIYDEIVCRMIRETSCNSKRRFTPSADPERDYRSRTNNFLITKDPNARILPKGVAFNRQFTGKNALKVHSIIRKYVESGLVEFCINFVENLDLMSNFRVPNRITPEVLDNVTSCKNDHLSRPEVHSTDAVGLKNFRTLAFFCSGLVVACSLVLWCEIVLKLKRRKSIAITGK